MMDIYSAGTGHSTGWVNPTLTVIFLIHTIAFVYLYIKRRHYYTAMLVVAFPLLCLYYLLRTLHVDFAGMTWIRWAGIGIATLSVVLALKDYLVRKSKQKKQ